MKLSQMQTGKIYIIKVLPRDDPLSCRLLDMGFSEGMEVSAVLKGRGIWEVKIGETLVALRPADCDKAVICEAGRQ